MFVQGKTHSYTVVKRVAEASAFRLYLCTQEGTGRECLLKIVPDAARNGDLDRETFILGELIRRADELEARYARERPDAKVPLNYGLFFPELIESFLFAEQGGRRVSVFAFREVPEVRRMVPIGNVIRKDRLCIDLRTSAWIMGKALKLLAFTHAEGISVGRADTTNLLIEPDRHYVLIFDWSAATLHEEIVPAETRRNEIVQAARSVIALLVDDDHIAVAERDGYDVVDFGLTNEPEERPYVDYLVTLAQGGERDAGLAHERFYALVDGLWPREFYPFTTFPRASRSSVSSSTAHNKESCHG